MGDVIEILTTATNTVEVEAAGPQGIPGVGVPTGGSTGQVLRKASSADYATEWAAAGSGSGSVTSVAMASTDLTISGSPITESGTITANIAANAVTLEKLQTISSEHLLGRHGSGNGGVQQIGLGTGLAISGSNVRVATTGITAGTYTKLTIDETGRATVGATASPSDIGAQSLPTRESLTITENTTLAAARYKIYEIAATSGTAYDLILPSNNAAGDVVALEYGFISSNSAVTIKTANGSPVAVFNNLRRGGFVFRNTLGTDNGWIAVPVATHQQDLSDAGQVTGLLGLANGGLATNVSAYSGLVKISGGSTSAVTVTSAGEALLDDADSAAQRTTLGLGTAAVEAASAFAQASHSHELTALAATGATNGHVLTANGSGGVTFAAASASGVTGAAASASDVLGVSGSDITGVDANADRIIFWDDSSSALKHLTVGSGLSLTDTTLTATGGGVTTGSVDNAVLRADGTGGSTSQGSAFVIADNATASPNNTVNHASIQATGDTTNVSVSIVPKGTGAFMLRVPDSASTGGNSRGVNAVDLMLERLAANQVASGEASFAAGARHIVSGARAAAVGGYGSMASASNAVTLGALNTATGETAGSLCGYFNDATASEAVVVGGNSNDATAARSSVIGGNNNIASADSSICVGGQRATANRFCIHAHAAGQFAAGGDAQRIRAVLRCKTTTNAAVEMALDGSTTYLTIPSGKVIYAEIRVVGTKSDGSAVACFTRQYAAKNVAGTSSEVFAPVTIGTDTAAGTSLEVAAVDAGDYIRIRPTGIASETWRWVASVDAVEVAYGS